MDSYQSMILVGAVFFAAFFTVAIVWRSNRKASMLEGWARENGFELLSQEICWFFKGPFFWTSSKGQEVYRVTVRDRQGRTRSGYVRLGGFWLGLMSDRVDVRWDD